MTQIDQILATHFGVQGRVALVNGAASGIGQAVVTALARLGASVVATDADFPEQTGAEDGVERIVADPASEQAVVDLFDKVREKYGRLDILVNAATEFINAPLVELCAEQWDRSHAVNTRAAFLACREAVKLMKPGGGGHIVIVTTIGAQHPVLNGNAAYSASKAAAGMLAKNISLEHIRDGITVNVVQPGAVITPSVNAAAGGIRPTGPGADPARHLSGFFSPQDVVPTILFFCGPAARYVTAQSIAVDGGFQVA